MLIISVRKAFGELFDPTLRQVFWKSIGLTLLALIILWNIISALIETLAIPFLSQWLFPFNLSEWASEFGFFATLLSGISLVAALAFLIGPVSAVIAGFFLDDVATHIEEQDYPSDVPGKAMPLGQSILISLKFFGVIIVGNLFALMLLLVPGINLIAFFAVNGYLLGREYFEFAALRHHDTQKVRRLRAQHSSTIILGGMMIAGFLAIPIVNLMTPLFGAAFMVHLQKAITTNDKRNF